MIKSNIVNILADGKTEITEYGEFLAYKKAFRQLLKAFLKRISSLDETQQKLRLQLALTYIEEHLKNADDFLDHIGGISEAIKIKESILQKFVASHLLNLLEKAKSSLLIEELEKVKTIANPNHLISQELLLSLGFAIMQPMENYFLPNGMRNAPDTATNANSSLVVKKVETDEDVISRMPSLELLQIVEAEFQNSAPINFNAKEVDSQLINPAMQMGKAAPIKKEGPSTSVELMEKMDSLFPSGSPSLYDLYIKKQQQAKEKKKGGSLKKIEPKIDTQAIDNQIQAISQNLLNFKIYYELMSILISFQSKPTEYKHWLNTEATPLQKAIIELRNKLVMENKKQAVDWVEFNSRWANSLAVSSDSVSQLKKDILLYDKAKAYLRRLETRVIQHCGKSKIDARPHLKNSRSILLDVFDKKGSLSGKKRALKMIKMKVAHPGVAKLIEAATNQELPFLAKLYGLR